MSIYMSAHILLVLLFWRTLTETNIFFILSKTSGTDTICWSTVLFGPGCSYCRRTQNCSQDTCHFQSFVITTPRECQQGVWERTAPTAESQTQKELRTQRCCTFLHNSTQRKINLDCNPHIHGISWMIHSKDGGPYLIYLSPCAWWHAY